MNVKPDYRTFIDRLSLRVKTGMVIKLTIVFFLFFAYQVSANSYAQNITIIRKNVSLSNVFKTIEQQTGFLFFYDKQLIQKTRPIDISIKNATIEETLSACLKGQGFIYTIVRNTIVIQPEKPKTSSQAYTDGEADFLSALHIIKGRVVNKTGAPLQGVSISVSGTKAGVTTDKDGRFSINVPDNQNIVLEVSSVGYQSRTIPVGDQTEFSITLEEDISGLDDMVVVGYGTRKKRDITGSVVSLDQKRLDDLPNTNFVQALAGAVPGLSVVLNSAGAEQNNNSLIIRGSNSIKATNTPLIIIDGVPYNGNISDINPVDIASIDILKDASAAAIYGSRSSNGVILVTTKRGSTGKPVISYDAFYSMQKIDHTPTYLTPEQFYEFKKTRVPSSITLSEQEVYDSKEFPDWVGLTTRKGSRQQHSLGVRGGTDKTKYYISGTYLNVKGIAVNDDFKRVSTRLNLEIGINDWLSFGSNTQLAYTNRDGLPADFSTPQNGAYAFNPLTTAFDEEGKLTIYPWPANVGFSNPMAPTLAKNKDENFAVFSNNYLLVQFPFLQGLSYRLNTGIEYSARQQKTYYGRGTKIGLEANGDLNIGNSLNKNYTIENIVSYNHKFGDHSIDFTGLYSYEYNNMNSDALRGKGFPNDILGFYQADVALSLVPTTNYARETLLSQMGRINYGYKNKYLLTFTGRRDGFSGFGADNKFSFFPSVALGWNLSSEKFMAAAGGISTLKLRLSYGSNGNQAVGGYQTLAIMDKRPFIDGATTAPGYVPVSLANPNLHWESTNTANIGIDFGLWNGRIQGALDAYQSNTHDLLLDRQISSVQGVRSITENIGELSNKGIELGLNTINISNKNFNWTTNLNISTNKNKIIALYGDNKNDTLNEWFLGYPINVNFGYVYDGVYQEKDDIVNGPEPTAKPGSAKVRNLNDDNVINDKDRTIIGTRQPRFIWGMGNTFKYNNFSLYVFMKGVQGTSRPNTLLADEVNSDVAHNTVLKNWWTPENPTNEYYANVSGSNPHNALIYENDSYLRISDISLSYDFSARALERLKFSRLRIYLNIRNAVTITKWTGLDPELSNQVGIPLQKEYLIGLNINL